MENDKTMFDEIVRTEINPAGAAEASLVENPAQDMDDAVKEMVRCWKDFKDANPEYPMGVWSYQWWKALVYLALAEDHLKEQFLGRDRTPASVKQYHRWRLSLCDGRPFRTNA
jgi:hypothetical protein